MYMKRSTFGKMKYTYKLAFFFEGQVYDLGRFQNTGSHTRTKIIHIHHLDPLIPQLLVIAYLLLLFLTIASD